MQSIGISEIQKNTSILSHITEALQIVDKRKNKKIAIIYPIKKKHTIDNLAGKYKDRVKKSRLSLDKIKEQATIEAFGEKYGLSHRH